MITTKLNKEAIQDLTDKLLSARNSNLKMVLDIDHRLQLVGSKDGVEYINDSKSTTVTATHYSLTCMEGPVIWLLSCLETRQRFGELKSLVDEKVNAIFFLGKEDDPFIEEFIQHVDVIQSCDTMVELVSESMKLAEAGDTVLFSPASAVSDAYEGYGERGAEFKTAVESLID